MAELLSEHRDHQAGGGARGRGVGRPSKAVLNQEAYIIQFGTVGNQSDSQDLR